MKQTLMIAVFCSLMLLGLAPAWSEVQTKTIRYQDGDVELQGYLAWDDAAESRRPGVIVVHEWWGLNDYARSRAEALAALGYVAFAADMYGADKVTEHGSQAKEWMQQITANQQAWQNRAALGLEVLKGHKLVDADRLAAIGYCFGGATVMQMAYSGADLKGVVSFHGSLPVATEEQQGRIKAAVLVAHGEADAFVPAERVDQCRAALEKAGTDWEMNIYGGVRHGFTNPDASRYGIDNLVYDERADRRSWKRMQLFFDEIFAE